MYTEARTTSQRDWQAARLRETGVGARGVARGWALRIVLADCQWKAAYAWPRNPSLWDTSRAAAELCLAQVLLSPRAMAQWDLGKLRSFHSGSLNPRRAALIYVSEEYVDLARRIISGRLGDRGCAIATGFLRAVAVPMPVPASAPQDGETFDS